MKRFSPRLLLACTLICVLVPAVTAAAADPAPTQDLPATATYGDLEVPVSLAVGMGLNCNLIGDGLSCYPSEADAQTAAVDAAVLAASCSPPMTLYDGTSFTGASVSIFTQGVWINLSGIGGGFANRTSSWVTGCAGGYLADGTGGAGTRIGMAAGGQQASLGTFNNLASSARRCPC